MRRQVTVAEVRCDLCLHDISGCILCGRAPDVSAGPLDFCVRHRVEGRPCESCGSLSTFPDPQATWAGNCLACWRVAMTLPRGKCSARGIGWAGCGRAHPTDIRHSCDQLANHPDAHHCPDCDANWGLR